MKTLVIYYSYGHHTRDVAEMIEDRLSCDIEEILPVKPYTAIYQDLVNATENNREIRKTPDIRPLKVDINNYDRIIIGTPVWWYTMAEPVRTFLKENDFSGKEILVYATDAGWIGTTFSDMQELIGENKIKTLDVKYSVDGASRLTGDKAIEQFIG
jgi:flavodoxin